MSTEKATCFEPRQQRIQRAAARFGHSRRDAESPEAPLGAAHRMETRNAPGNATNKLKEVGLGGEIVFARELQELLGIVERKLGLCTSSDAGSENGVERTPEAQLPLVYVPPSAIWRQLDHYVQCVISGESAGSRDLLEQFLEDLLRYSVRTKHAFFLHRLYGGSDPVGQIADLICSVLNNSADTFSAAPYLVLLERRVIEALSSCIGWKTPLQGDGIFCPGGSYANLIALTTARHVFQMNARRPQTKRTQRHHCNERRMGIFTSVQGHYSVRRNAAMLGFCDAPGEDCSDVVLVPCDEEGRMDPEALRRLIRCFRNTRPLSSVFVNVTAGTTVLSAFDPLPEIWTVLAEAFPLNSIESASAELGQRLEADTMIRERLPQPTFWVHVDGALGGSFLFSERFRPVALAGLEKYANSFVLNAHKLLNAPLQCSILLVRERGLLQAAHAARAPYLFHDDLDTDAQYDIGDMTLTCSRRSDALKFWLMWMWRGSAGFGARVEAAARNARAIAEAMAKRPCFLLVHWPLDRSYPATNVCFYYLPSDMRESIRNLADIKAETAAQLLGSISVRLCRALQVSGKALLNYCTLEGTDLPIFLRLALHGLHVYEEQEIQDLLNRIEDCGDHAIRPGTPASISGNVSGGVSPVGDGAHNAVL